MSDELSLEDFFIVRQRASEIEALVTKTVRNIIAIGEKLIEIKELLPHGSFEPWLKSRFDWSLASAKRFMNVAVQFKSLKLSDLSIASSALYLLATPSTPEAARQEAISLAQQGETISHSKAKTIVDRHKTSTEGELKQKAQSLGLPTSSTQVLPSIQRNNSSAYDVENGLATDLAAFEAIATEPIAAEHTTIAVAAVPVATAESLVQFQCLLTHQQREQLFAAINQAKSKHNLETTAEALGVIAQEYLDV